MAFVPRGMGTTWPGVATACVAGGEGPGLEVERTLLLRDWVWNVVEEACALRGGSGCVCEPGVQGVKVGEVGGRGGAGAWREHCSQGRGDSTAGKGGQSLATGTVRGQGEGGGQQLAEEPRAGERGGSGTQSRKCSRKGWPVTWARGRPEAAKGTKRSGAGRTEVLDDLDGRRLGLWGMHAALEGRGRGIVGGGKGEGRGRRVLRSSCCLYGRF